jgi:hypothetical protein
MRTVEGRIETLEPLTLRGTWSKHVFEEVVSAWKTLLVLMAAVGIHLSS